MCPGPKAAAAHAAMDVTAHSKFFDHLVDLVPAKYYLNAGNEDQVRRLAASRGEQPGVLLAAAAAVARGGARQRRLCGLRPRVVVLCFSPGSY